MKYVCCLTDVARSTKDSQVMWTKNVTGFPNLTHEILEKHFILNLSVTDKQPKWATWHKLGYQLFKSGYVNSIVVKPNIKMGDKMLKWESTWFMYISCNVLTMFLMPNVNVRQEREVFVNMLLQFCSICWNLSCLQCLMIYLLPRNCKSGMYLQLEMKWKVLFFWGLLFE